MNKRVVITGVGLISELGDSAEALHQNLCAGASGLGEITEYEAQGFDSQPGGSISTFVPEMYLKGRPLRPLDRTGKLFASAARLALESSGWTSGYLATHDVGVVMGTRFGGMRPIAQFYR